MKNALLAFLALCFTFALAPGGQAMERDTFLSKVAGVHRTVIEDETGTMNVLAVVKKVFKARLDQSILTFYLEVDDKIISRKTYKLPAHIPVSEGKIKIPHKWEGRYHKRSLWKGEHFKQGRAGKFIHIDDREYFLRTIAFKAHREGPGKDDFAIQLDEMIFWKTGFSPLKKKYVIKIASGDSGDRP